MGAAYYPPRGRPPLAPEVHRVLKRGDHRVEVLTFTTLPGVRATATLYLPTRHPAPRPAVLCVHGHWAGARRDPVVQARCIGLARLGFVALTLDAWGAGERGTRPGQNEYHGGLLGASLWPVGTPLHGLQLMENIRALDLLQSRPEVDSRRLGCTGASGGGNQTTQLSALDSRIRCAVPVCSVGTFADYLTTACCVDEVVNGGLTFAEEGDFLGAVAPGALLVITASRDAYHFGPESAARAVERARPYFHVHGDETGARLRHLVFDSGHDYSRPMREAMYGWMRRWLVGEGDGSPVPEPELTPEDPEVLRCYPPEARPAAVTTTVAWVGERTSRLAAAHALPSAGRWPEERRRRLQGLRAALVLPTLEHPPLLHRRGEQTCLESEPGLRVPLTSFPASAPPHEPGSRALVALNPEGRGSIPFELIRELAASGIGLHALELRGCGELELPGQQLGVELPDHNLSEWGIWLGRPLLDQWLGDALALIARLRADGARGVAVAGWREAGMAAILAAALGAADAAVTLGAPLTLRTETPPHHARLVLFRPDLTRLAGDLPQLAALAAPRALLLGAPMRLDGMPATPEELQHAAAPLASLYAGLGHPERLRTVPSAQLSWSLVAEHVADWLGR